MTTTTTIRQPTREEFKQLSADIAPAAHAVLTARAHADLERARVAAYVAPIFATYHFTVAPEFRRRGDAEKFPAWRITNQDHLYLSNDEEQAKRYFAECDAAHRAHGFTGPDGHCPALHAEGDVMEAENALINLATPTTGVESWHLHSEKRAHYLDILIGAALAAERER